MGFELCEENQNIPYNLFLFFTHTLLSICKLSMKNSFSSTLCFDKHFLSFSGNKVFVFVIIFFPVSRLFYV